MDEEELDFGGPPAPAGGGVPFPRMRLSPQLRERWAQVLEASNKAHGRKDSLSAPLDAVGKLLDQRGMAPMSWPAAWPEAARRARTYPGDCIGIVGAMGGGKTSFAMQIALANCADGHPLLWAALELGNVQATTRIVGNMHGAHAASVRDSWPEDRIRHALTAVSDGWRFVDRYSDVDEQFAAVERAIMVAWKVYGVPPVVVIDHLGVLVARERDERTAILIVADRFREMAERTNAIIILLSQVSVSNQAVLTGRAELDNASDALGIEAGGRALGSACSQCIGLAVFKVDDAYRLDAHALYTKCRHTGLEGRHGMWFSKAGGVWHEYLTGHLPPTTAQVAAERDKDKKDKARIATAVPPRTPAQVRTDINLSRAGDAEAMARVKILERIREHGFLGMEIVEIKRIQGALRGALLQRALDELGRGGLIERYGTKYRAIGKIE